ncbi:MAG: agmatinase [Thermomicrobium sp.]|nr:agmatinase [Thermomicrobium sp.]MDW8059597.1 agmatinase [Thermomicrobium sp.]
MHEPKQGQPTVWRPRFSGLRTFARFPHTVELDGVDLAIVGIPFDTGVTYRPGARFGPAAIREQSSRIEEYHPVLDLDVTEVLSIVDYGDTPVVPMETERSFEAIARTLEPLVARGIVTIGLGGDHSVSLPELRAVAARYGPLALVHFDAHVDTWDTIWDTRYNHGTPFRRAVEEGLVDPQRSIQVGIRGSLGDRGELEQSRELGFEVWTAREVRSAGLAAVSAAIRQRVGSHPVFLSFDIDFLDPAFAPGTGTPEVGGFATWEAQEFLWNLVGLRIVAADLVEVLPDRDPAGVTALNAANLVFDMIAVIAATRKGSEHGATERAE